jgi:hypothetical protein
MKIILTNAFSLNILAVDCLIDIASLSIDEVRRILDQSPWVSAIGHEDTAAIINNLLELRREVTCNRVTITLKPGDIVIVAQYIGPRLPEGTTTLPEGSQISFKRVEVYLG